GPHPTWRLLKVGDVDGRLDLTLLPAHTNIGGHTHPLAQGFVGHVIHPKRFSQRAFARPESLGQGLIEHYYERLGSCVADVKFAAIENRRSQSSEVVGRDGDVTSGLARLTVGVRRRRGTSFDEKAHSERSGQRRRACSSGRNHTREVLNPLVDTLKGQRGLR